MRESRGRHFPFRRGAIIHSEEKGILSGKMNGYIHEKCTVHGEISGMIYKRKDAFHLEKHGVAMWVYNSVQDCPGAAVVWQETETGHAEEFLHERSAFIFYIVEGGGVWVIEDVEYPVEAGDVVIVPPGKRFYYRGCLRQVCVTAPAWEEQYERHVRFISPPES
jgi:mannose-6-phosphate isomerase-like protein (cupin superfamily)